MPSWSVRPSNGAVARFPPDALPPRAGPVYVGVDLGMHASFCAAAMYWPLSGRFEVRSACPDQPALKKRATKDGAGDVYETAAARGDLWPLSGIVTPVRPFLERLAGDLAGCRIAAVGCDRFRYHELIRNLGDLGLPWRPTWRGAGVRAGEHMDADVREFQRAVATASLKTAPHLMMMYSVSEAKVVRDGQGHVVHLAGLRQRSRIDPVQAGVIALGLGAAAGAKRPPGKTWIA